MTEIVVPSEAKARAVVPFNDLSFQWDIIADDVRRDFDSIFQNSAFCQGPAAEAFESAAAAYLGVTHAVGVASGTAALHLAMVAAGIGPGDEVLVPSHTFIATIWGILYVGATPVLCDVDAATGTIDIQDAERRVTKRARAILPVHLYGQPAQMDEVLAFSERHGLIVVEDAAQSFGACWNGRATGTIGTFGCYSFYPGKNLGAAGEGGMIVTANGKVADRLRALRNHGQRERYIHAEIGFNYRMDSMQGVVLRHKLKHLAGWTRQRREMAARYNDAMRGLPLTLPEVRHQDHVWHLYVVRTPRRDALRAHLQRCGVDTALHYPVPCHRQPCLAHLPVDQNSFPNADRWANEGLSLPLFTGMGEAQLATVVDSVRTFFRHG